MEDVDVVEEKCVEAFTHLVVHLSESLFRPMFLKVHTCTCTDVQCTCTCMRPLSSASSTYILNTCCTYTYYGSMYMYMYMYIQLLYWATHKGGSKDRLISFYHLANGLALHT